jgi:hypothetical protein
MKLLSSTLCNFSISKMKRPFSTCAFLKLVQQPPAPSAALAAMQMVVLHPLAFRNTQ